jgi:hypothetical protein
MTERDDRVEREKSLCMSYASAFEGKDGKDVLADLREFCGADRACFDQNDRTEAFGLGARSVWLYIQERISMKSLRRLDLYVEDSDTDKTVKSSQ